MRDLQFCVIGCGRVAVNHLQAIAELPEARLTAVCDILVERAQKFGTKYKVPWYTNYHEMLSRQQIDVVCIITPSGMHAEHAVDVIRRYGKNVIVEKPLALSLSSAEAMHAAAIEADVTVFPVYQNRYNTAVVAVKAALERGTLGKLSIGSVRLHWCRPQRYYELSPWRGTWAMDGGAYSNQGIHYLDLLLHLMGNVESVSSLIGTQLADIEVEDTGVAVLRFAGGALGTVEITTAARPVDAEATISILGENGTAVIAGLSANRLVSWTPDPDLCPQVSEDIPNAYGFGHKRFIRDVIRHLIDGKQHPLSFEEGMRAIRLLNALYRSAEDGSMVDPSKCPESWKLGSENPKLRAMYTSLPSKVDL
jgi:predicted dehydrogenase